MIGGYVVLNHFAVAVGAEPKEHARRFTKTFESHYKQWSGRLEGTSYIANNQ